jgi:5-methyltetrahydrofolate--homocysteine methyltransferase
VLQDLQQQGLSFPVICGGAALTRKYVEDDLRREYSSSVFYGGDAFDGLHVMEDLTSAVRRDARLAEGREVKRFARAAVAAAEAEVSTERSPVVQPASQIPRPPFWGVRVRKDFDLREIFRYINETALFKNQWQLKTASQSDYIRLVEEKFRPLRCSLQEEVIAAGLFEPKAVWGYFPAQSEGNDVIVYEPGGEWETGNGKRELLRFTFPRQKEGRRLCIADFLRSRASGEMDVLGLALVTIGSQASSETRRLFEAGEYTRYLYLHGLSVETAEALAEYQHKLMREDLGIAGEDATEVRDLFHQKYRGSRYSFGYPACPNLEDQTKLFRLLRPEETIGVHLTTGYLLEPEQSTSAIVIHHPAAKYFVA